MLVENYGSDAEELNISSKNLPVEQGSKSKEKLRRNILPIPNTVASFCLTDLIEVEPEGSTGSDHNEDSVLVGETSELESLLGCVPIAH